MVGKDPHTDDYEFTPQKARGYKQQEKLPKLEISSVALSSTSDLTITFSRPVKSLFTSEKDNEKALRHLTEQL